MRSKALLPILLSCALAWPAAPAMAADDGVAADLLRSARVWRVHGRSEFSRAALAKLLAIEPDHAEALLQLGLLEITAGRFDDARQALERLRQTQPDGFRVTELDNALRIADTDRLEMANIRRLLQTGDVDAAWERLQALFPEGPPGGQLGIEYHLAQARLDGGEAAARLGLARLARQHPSDPQYRLAVLRLHLRDAPNDRAALDELEALTSRRDLAIGSADSALRNALLDAEDDPDIRARIERYLARVPSDSEVAAHLQALREAPPQTADRRPPPSASAPAQAPPPRRTGPPPPPPPPSPRELTLRSWRQIASEATTEAAFAWQDAIAGLEDENFYRAAVAAESLAQAGFPAPAEALLRDLLALDPTHLASLERLSQLMLDSDREDDAMRRLDQADQAGADTSAIRADIHDARAERALQSGDPARAEQERTRALELTPGDPWRRYRLAKMQAADGREAQAIALMTLGAAQFPSDDLHYAQALLYSSLDRTVESLSAVLEVPWERRSEGMRELQRSLEVEQWLAEARHQHQLGEIEASEQMLLWAEQAAAGDPDLLERCAAQRQDFLPAPPATVASSAAEPAVASRPAEPERSALRSSLRAEQFEIPGEKGYSELRLSQAALALEYSYGPWEGFIQIDPVRIDSGAFRPSSDFAEDYGSMAVADDAQRAALPEAIPTAEFGVALGVGLGYGPWTLDLGTRPIGFERNGWVGGLRHDGDLGPIDTTLTISRRPVTSSQLAYAGSIDPVSGQFWGLVSRDAVALRLARYEYAWSAFFSVDAAHYSGVGIPDNRGLRFWTGGDHDLWRGHGLRLEAGLRLTAWMFDRNQRFYTLGHGGYYSPQHFLSGSILADFSGALGRFDWRLRVAPSWSDSDEDTVPLYPHDPALQAAAELALGEDDAYHAGGPGGGFGLSLQAVAEYRLSAALTLGVQLATDRSDFYEPFGGLIYLRHGHGDTPLRVPGPYADR